MTIVCAVDYNADNDPLNLTDPTGMRPSDDSTFGGGGRGFLAMGMVPTSIGFCNDGHIFWCNDDPKPDFDPGYDRVVKPWWPLPPMPPGLGDGDDANGKACAAAVVSAAMFSWSGPSVADISAGCAVAYDWGTRLSRPEFSSQFSGAPGERNAERHFVLAASLAYNAGSDGAFAALEIHERYGHCSSPVQSECDHDHDVDERNNQWGVGYGLHRRYDFGLAFHADNERMFDDFLREARRLIVNRVLDTSGACEHTTSTNGEC